MRLDALVRGLRANGHYFLSCLFALAIIPVFKATGLHSFHQLAAADPFVLGRALAAHSIWLP